MSSGPGLINIQGRVFTILLGDHELDENNIQVTWIPLNKIQDKLGSSHGLTRSEHDVTSFAYLMHSS